MYCSIKQVRDAISVTDTDDLSDDTILQSIEFAQDEIDRLTYTTYYPVEDRGTVTDSDDDELEDDKQEWVVNDYAGYVVYIYSGTGQGQLREIISNTADTLKVADWDTNPDTTSKYIISWLNKQTIKVDGSGTYEINLKDYPIVQIDSLKIDDTAIDPDNYEIYNDIGKIVLAINAEESTFKAPISNLHRKMVEVTYHWGVLPTFRHGKISIDSVVQRGVVLLAALQSITSQIGGTYDVASTWTLPEMGVTRGQAYINLRSAYDSLKEEWEKYKSQYLGKYVYMV